MKNPDERQEKIDAYWAQREAGIQSRVKEILTKLAELGKAGVDIRMGFFGESARKVFNLEFHYDWKEGVKKIKVPWPKVVEAKHEKETPNN